MGGRYCFQFVSPQLDRKGGGYPHPSHEERYPHPSQPGVEGTPILPNWEGGYPHPRSGWVVLPPSQVWTGGIPIPDLGNGIAPSRVRMGGTPSQVMGYPPSWDGGTAPPRSGPKSGGGGFPNWYSIACTWYTAGGMPLAFTQEDSLVIFDFTIVSLHDHFQSFVVTFTAGLQVPNRSLRLHQEVTEATSQGEKTTGTGRGYCAATRRYGQALIGCSTTSDLNSLLTYTGTDAGFNPPLEGFPPN